ncbi:protein tyrosine phosphatase [Aliidiomarina shirensis]|uniref:protein-tyrosine-phosphatase n=1 Tax=Aliidiomarina shirensis TaxID=1048642 RepID=A0A432WU61_9GAMM|nr:low molecular weight protein-tyrosine-phosphatase [Aliidiomarina shirensis]RUO37310.1 protein tyrosine phosphatase [Aliidiomarina shirensis]
MFDKILIVCIGNICRSPTAQFLLQRELPHKHIRSAGLYAMVNTDENGNERGQEMNSQAREIAEKHGLICGAHEATQFTSELGRNHDLILVMEKRHRDDIAKRFPEALAKTMLLGEWDAQREGNKDIPDPYRKSDEVFEQIYKLIERNTMLWANKLK